MQRKNEDPASGRYRAAEEAGDGCVSRMETSLEEGKEQKREEPSSTHVLADDPVEICAQEGQKTAASNSRKKDTSTHQDANPMSDVARNILRTQNQSVAERFLNVGGSSGNAAAHRACRENDHKKLQKLLEFKAHINAQNVKRETPLHIAARLGHRECVEVLLNFGAVAASVDVQHGGAAAESNAVSTSKVVSLSPEEVSVSIASGASKLDFGLRSRIGNFVWEETTDADLRELILSHAQKIDPNSVRLAVEVYGRSASAIEHHT